MKALKEKSSQLSVVETYHIVLPSHANALGTVFGGTIMSWIDIAAAICAQRHSEQICVTASVDTLNFLSPIKTGDTVHLRARVVYTGKTSMMVEVIVEGEDFRNARRFRAVVAYLTFVALDSNKKPAAVPPLKLECDADKQAFEAAAKRREALLSQRHS